MNSSQRFTCSMGALVASAVLPYVEKCGWPKAPQRAPDGTVDMSSGLIRIWHVEQVGEYDLFVYNCEKWMENRTHLALVIDGTAITVSVGSDNCVLSFSVFRDGCGGGKEFVECIQEFSERKFLGG